VQRRKENERGKELERRKKNKMRGYADWKTGKISVISRTPFREGKISRKALHRIEREDTKTKSRERTTRGKDTIEEKGNE
jgi:hypothetical protein